MASVVGELVVNVGGKEYTLRLGFRELGKLQDEFGQDLAPFMQAHEEGLVPNFNAVVRLVEVSLSRYHPDAGPDVADDILASEMSIFGKLMAAAFPAPEEPQKPQKPAAKKTRAAV